MRATVCAHDDPLRIPHSVMAARRLPPDHDPVVAAHVPGLMPPDLIRWCSG